MWDGERIRARMAEKQLASDRYLLAPPVGDAEVRSFEARIGVTLPEEYRSFLLEVGNGPPRPSLGLRSLDRTVPDDVDPAAPFPHTEAWNPHDQAVTMTDDEYFDGRWAAGTITIFDEGCGHTCLLVLNGPARGTVWFDGRPGDYGIKPAGTYPEWFEEFLG